MLTYICAQHQEGMMTSILLQREEEEHVTSCFSHGESRISCVHYKFRLSCSKCVGEAWVKVE